MQAVEKMYQGYYKNERYLKNTAPMARVAIVYSEQTNQKYGGKPWQEKSNEHTLGMYHVLVEDHMPFEMVNDQLLDAERLKPFKLLILPNIAALSDSQCGQIRAFVDRGGSVVATFETSLYDEEGRPRPNFGLADMLGVSFDGAVEGPMRNSYLRLKGDENGHFHPVLQGLEDAYKIINSVYQVKVRPGAESTGPRPGTGADPSLNPNSSLGTIPGPVTLIPSYPDLPMEDVYPRIEATDTPELYLSEKGKGRVAYFPGDLDRSFWQIMSTDHSRLLRNTIRWALNEDPIVGVQAAGVIDVAVWRQKDSMTVHLVNLTNPMMMKGPFRELLPVDARVKINIPNDKKVTGVHLLMSGATPEFQNRAGVLTLQVPSIMDHEIVALDLA